MARILSLLVCAVLLLTEFARGEGTTVVSPQSSAVTSVVGVGVTNAGARMLVDPVGVWEGRWDGTYKVRFTISKGADQTYEVVYDREEYVGQPMVLGQKAPADYRDGTLYYGALEVHFIDTNQAVATGRWKRVRTAKLTRP